MKLSNCPHLDILGREMIEAYRRSGDLDGISLVDTEFSHVQRRIVAHRADCVICREVGRGKYPRRRRELPVAS